MNKSQVLIVIMKKKITGTLPIRAEGTEVVRVVEEQVACSTCSGQQRVCLIVAGVFLCCRDRGVEDEHKEDGSA